MLVTHFGRTSLIWVMDFHLVWMLTCVQIIPLPQCLIKRLITLSGTVKPCSCGCVVNLIIGLERFGMSKIKILAKI